MYKQITLIIFLALSINIQANNSKQSTQKLEKPIHPKFQTLRDYLKQETEFYKNKSIKNTSTIIEKQKTIKK